MWSEPDWAGPGENRARDATGRGQADEIGRRNMPMRSARDADWIADTTVTPRIGATDSGPKRGSAITHILDQSGRVSS
jgi:hypothetical protein